MENLAFCEECRKETEYSLRKRKIVNDNGFEFVITVAVCKECGTEMDIPGLIDKNIQEFDEQYRIHEGIISMEDMERLVKRYNNDLTELSIALGVGEEIISHYLSGQIPSKEQSDVMKRLLLQGSPE